MSNRNRPAALLLAFCLLLPIFAGCAGAPDPEETKEAGTNAATAATEPDTPDTDSGHADPGLPRIDFDNADFTVFACEQVYSDGAAPRDIVYFEDRLSDTINEAVHDRNVYVEDKYGVSIGALWVPELHLMDDVKKLIASGEHAFDVAELGFNFAGEMAVNGLLRNAAGTSDYLDLSQSYWDQGVMESMSIGGVVYFISGDMMVTDKGGTWAMCFNRELAKNNLLGNLYDEVRAGTWNYDALNRYAAAVCDFESHAPDDYFGITWGILSEAANAYAMWSAGGHRIIEKNENDIPKVADLNEGAFDDMVTVAATQSAGYTLLAHDIRGVDNKFFDGTYKIFQSGHGLFFIGSMSMVEWMRSSDVDFGVLPMPKFSETQKNYTSTISRTRSWCLSLPYYSDITGQEADRVGIVLQALACESTATVREAYYDLTLVYKGLRKEEDVEMLDLIFKNRIYDLNHAYGWADNLVDEISSYKSEKLIRRFQSMYDSYKGGVAQRIQKYLEANGLA